MRGILLAGGRGLRLAPTTVSTSKQLLPIYDKPTVFYPLATLMSSGIREIAIITTPDQANQFKLLLGDGSRFGVFIHYFTQVEPRGLADAFLITKNFISNHKVGLILGDNLFHGSGLGSELKKYSQVNGAQIFGYRVANPSDYGVVEIDSSGKVLSIEEKPKFPKSFYAIPGLYFYDENVSEYAAAVMPSSRGELEITEVINHYLNAGKLSVTILPRGTAWFDTGSADNLLDASNYVKAIEHRQNLKIACLEEIAWRQKWISNEELIASSYIFRHSIYGEYIKSLLCD